MKTIHIDASRSYDVSDGLLVVGGHVYRPVEGALHASGGLYELSCALDVDLAVGGEDAEDDTRSSRLAGIVDVQEHSLELVVGV